MISTIFQDGFSNNFAIPIVRVDPESRCAAMVVSNAHLAILPIRRRGPAEQQIQNDPKDTKYVFVAQMQT